MIKLHNYITHEVAQEFCEALYAINGPVEISINSYGGDVVATYSIVTELLKRDDVTIYIDGMAYSCASWITSACSKVVARTYSVFGIHNPYSNDSSKDLSAIKDSIINIYMKKSNLSMEEISLMMDKDTCMRAEEALKYNFVDVIMDINTEEEYDMDLSELEEYTEEIPMENKVINIYNKFNEKINKTVMLEEKKEEITQEVIIDKIVLKETIDNVVEEVTDTELIEDVVKEEILVDEKVEEIVEIVEIVENKLDLIQGKYETSLKNLEEIKNELSTLHNKYTEALLTIFKFEEKEKANKKEEIENILNIAIKANKITNESKVNWTTQFENDYTNTLNLLNSIPSVVNEKKELFNADKFFNEFNAVSEKEIVENTFKTKTAYDFVGKESELVNLYKLANKYDVVVPKNFNNK